MQLAFRPGHDVLTSPEGHQRPSAFSKEPVRVRSLDFSVIPGCVRRNLTFGKLLVPEGRREAKEASDDSPTDTALSQVWKLRSSDRRNDPGRALSYGRCFAALVPLL